MTNKDIIGLLEEIAVLLDLSGESPFKSRAYTNVARQIEQTEEDVASLAEEGRLREIKGVGDALEVKITEFVRTGALEYRDTLRAKFPDTLFELFGISGLGPKRIKQVYDELGICSLATLETACSDGSLSNLKGFGVKMQEKLLAGIAFAEEHQGRHLFDQAYDEARRLRHLLREVPSVSAIEIAGSLRRRKETIKDVDLVAACAKPEELMTRFVEDEHVARITGHGATKSSVVLKSGLAVDLRVVDAKEYPYALMHFTGSKEHNVVLRQRAKDRGLKLNEYGLFEGERNQACASEEGIYRALDLPYLPPEIREDVGEFDLTDTPALLEESDIKGMIHCHSRYSDGQNTVEEMALAAKELGYTYITMTDHSQSAAYAGGLRPAAVAKQHREIDALNETLKGIRIFKGIESDIRADGSLDYAEKVLQSFELVIASVHSNLDMTKAEATRRLVTAVENPYTSILGHPTGRLLLSRKGYEIDYDALFGACVEHGVAIEINANCRRLDLDWRQVRRAKDRGVKISIGPDAHNTGGLAQMSYGVGIARKGWLGKGDVLNCLSTGQFAKWCTGRIG